MPKDQFRHKGSTGYQVSHILPVSDRLVAAILGASYATPLDRGWKTPAYGPSVAAVSEARRLHKLGMSKGEISATLDGHGVKHTMGQLEGWLAWRVAIKGYPIIHENDEPYLVTPPETFQMNKRVALLKRMVEDAGLVFEKFLDKHDGRITCVANAGTAETRIFSIVLKEGDRRGDLNEASRMRRFARECGSPATQLAEKLKPVVEEFKKVAAVAPPTQDTVQQDPYLEGITAKLESNQSEEPHSREAIMNELKALPADTLANAIASFPARIETVKEFIPKPETPQPKKKTMAATKTNPRTAMSMENQYKLIEWMKSADLTKYATIKAFHIAANKALGLQFPYSTVALAMKIANVTITPATGKRDYVRAAPIIARNLLRVMKELGIEPDEELKRIATETT